jgi:hypothetical protein
MGIPVDLNERTNSICKEGSGRYGEEKAKLVPGDRYTRYCHRLCSRLIWPRSLARRVIGAARSQNPSDVRISEALRISALAIINGICHYGWHDNQN